MGRGGGEGRERGGKNGSHGHAAREGETSRAAAGREMEVGGIGVVGAAGGPAGGSGGGGGKGAGSGSRGRTGRGVGAWTQVLLSPREPCGAGWWGAGCGR